MSIGNGTRMSTCSADIHGSMVPQSDMSITQTSVQGGATMSEHVAWCSNYEISTTGYQLSHRVNHRFRKEERGAGNVTEEGAFSNDARIL